MSEHRSLAELEAGLAHINAAPRDEGTVEMIVIRPQENERKVLDSVEISAAGGTHGDLWKDGKAGKTSPPLPEAQICIMGARAIELIAGDRENWPIAGDNMFIDMDVRPENLPVGTRLALGTAIIEITRKPHLGCNKFEARFGKDALEFVNGMDGRAERRRGVYGMVVQDGRVSVGDKMVKIAAVAEPAA